MPKAPPKSNPITRAALQRSAGRPRDFSHHHAEIERIRRANRRRLGRMVLTGG